MGSLPRGLASAARHAVGRFFDRARLFVRELIVAGSMALNGPESLDDHDLAEADRQAVVQAEYLARFKGEVELSTPPELAVPMAPPDPNAMSAAQFIARAELYGNAAWAVQNGNRAKVIAGGKAVRERRLHLRDDPEKHACNGCLAESDRGWQPVGSLRPIGDCECKTNCDCYFVYEMADGSYFITAKGWTLPPGRRKVRLKRLGRETA